MELHQIKTIGIVGADIVGQGMAISAAIQGCDVYLYDIMSDRLDLAEHHIGDEIETIIQLNDYTQIDKKGVLSRIHFSYDIRNVKADIVVENLDEKKATKKKVIEELEKNNSHTSIIVTNTNFASVTQLGLGLNHPKRFIGIHLLHPVPVISLVELIKGESTSKETMHLVSDYIKAMNKTPVMVKDVPGFIVNRLTRPLYLESLKILEEGLASHEEIDSLLENSDFEQGAFKLMDYLGIDSDNSLSNHIFKAFAYEARFRPSRIEQLKVDAGYLGQKTGKGFYVYDKPNKN